MEAVLGIFDVTGIQNFIFNSNKLKENIGGSIIVKKTLSDYLIEALKKVSDKNDIDVFNDDWNNLNSENFKEKFTEGKKIIEVVYIGGGNAVIAFSHVEFYKETAKLFGIYLLEKTYSLNVASAFTNITENFDEDNKKLHLELSKVKRSMFRQTPMGNLPITNHDLKTGLPITYNEVHKNDSSISTDDLEMQIVLKWN